jgi:predicted DsbA family dithiol-disulfide isomerase
MATDHDLVVYSDYVCPFCYLGKASLEQYLAEAEDPPRVEWRHFDLRGHKRRPDGAIDESVDDGKDDAYFEQAKQNVRRLQERYGVEMSLEIALDVDSWNAQQAALFVREDRGEAPFHRFHGAVFDAMWRETRDIGDPEVLADVAESVDVDGDAVRAATDDERWDERLRERFADAKRAGITGIPTFVYGDHVARGAVPPEQLRRLVEGN